MGCKSITIAGVTYWVKLYEIWDTPKPKENNFDKLYLTLKGGGIEGIPSTANASRYLRDED